MPFRKILVTVQSSEHLSISVPTSSDEFCYAPSSEREFCLVVIVWLLLPIHNHNYNKIRGKKTLKKAKALDYL